MARKEEREAVAKNKYPYIKGLPQSSSHQSIFIEAAEWADHTMLDKACEWLEDKLRMYAGYSDTADLVDSFRKAMEE